MKRLAFLCADKLSHAKAKAYIVGHVSLIVHTRTSHTVCSVVIPAALLSASAPTATTTDTDAVRTGLFN